MADTQQSTIMTKPADPAITYQGKPLKPKRIVDLWNGNAEIMKPFHDECRRARDLRRGTLVRKIAESWATVHPEAALASVSRIPQRRTLEQDLKARSGLVEPAYICKALGDLQTDITHAQEFEDYLNEWATSDFGVPFPVFLDKGVEDGGYFRVRLPSMFDLEGRPDFFDRLSERAYEKLSDDEKKSYKKDAAGRRRTRSKPYIKVDDDGKEVPAEPYRAMMAEPDEDKDRLPLERAERKKRRADQASEKHKEAVRRYLLSRPASTSQVFGGLDVCPIFKRGIGRQQAELAAAITRQLVTVEEALEGNYGWKGMNGRLLVPRGASETNVVGRDGCYYLYGLYFTSTDEEGIVHPICAYTLGGYGTSMDGSEPESKDAVGWIDFYEELGIEGPLWSWHWGLKTRDEEPAYRGRPYLSDLIDLILAIESEEMAIRATTQVNAFTGYVEDLSDALRGPEATAVLEATVDSTTKELRKSDIPPPGEIRTSISTIRPFQQSQIGRDAWQILASDRTALAEATAVDQAATSPGASGRAIVVGETLAKVAKRDIRDEALEAFRRDGEDHARIVAAIFDECGIPWPIQKVEPPPSADPTADERYSIAEWKPEYNGEGRFTRLRAEYPEEENLAALDEEANLADRGYSHFGNVMKKKGITDPLREYQEVLEWELRRSPEYKMAVAMGVAQRRGDRTMVDILKRLQAEQQITEAGVPGARNGLPTSAIRRMGQGQNDQRGSGGPTAVQASKGGQMAAEMQTAQLNQEGTARMAVAGSAA